MKTVLKILLKTCRKGTLLALTWACLGAAAQAQVVCALIGSPADLRLNFGTHTTVAVNDATSPGWVRIRCENNSSDDRGIKVCVNLVSSSNGLLDGMRVLQRGSGTQASRIRYQIYRDAARSLVFGVVPDHAEFTVSIAANSTINLSPQIRLYGRIPAGETSVSQTGPHTNVFDATDLKIHYVDYPLGGSAPDCATMPGNPLFYNGVVQARLTTNCSIHVRSHIVFPNQTSLLNPVNGAGRLIVNCTQGVAYTIAMDDGLHMQGSQRRMRIEDGNDFVSYELYRNSARTARWGSDVHERQPRVGNGSAAIYPVYGRVLGGQTGVKPGNYKDTVLVTVHY